MAITLESTISCPECGFAREETMPTDACIWYWECPQCGALIRPKAGDCCVYCSYGTVPCPPLQVSGKKGCCGGSH
jgi:hypothetical protein